MDLGFNQTSPSPNAATEHYYGDAVRRLFVVGGVIMIVSLPFFSDLIPVGVYVSLFAILAVGFFAGLMNPKQLWVAILNLAISITAFAVFERYAAKTFVERVYFDRAAAFMWVNQILALNFFVAVYFASKTIRGMYLQKGRLIRRGDSAD